MFSQDIFARVDVAQSGSVYLGDFVAALTCVPKRRSVEVEPKNEGKNVHFFQTMYSYVSRKNFYWANGESTVPHWSTSQTAW